MSWLCLRIPPLIVAGLAAALIWGIAWILPSLSINIPLRFWIVAAFVLSGCAVAIWAIVSFRHAKTTVNPLNPEAASRLLVHGIYQYSRNPMYLGMLLTLAGWCVYHANVAAVVVLPCFVVYINQFQIRPEEGILGQKFGAAYQAYLTRVSRWFRF
jgi:protein-S-isoprenylcysteine O-methyltransferase Ste14